MKGSKKNMKKAEIWSLLTALTDEQATISASISEQNKALIQVKNKMESLERAEKARRNWDKENLRVVSTKLTTLEAEALEAYSQLTGWSKYELIRLALLELIKNKPTTNELNQRLSQLNTICPLEPAEAAQ